MSGMGGGKPAGWKRPTMRGRVDVSDLDHVKETIVNFRLLLHKLRVIEIGASQFLASRFIIAHSPAFRHLKR